jgi:uncharacterized membrane protein
MPVVKSHITFPYSNPALKIKGVVLLADFVLFIHLLIVIFNVGGLFAIWVGAWRKWGWVRNRTFRITHLGLILFIVAEAILGVACPLTMLEDWLRGAGSEQGFIERWIHSWLFWDLPSWVFIVVYSKFAALVAATWKLVPPQTTATKP